MSAARWRARRTGSSAASTTTATRQSRWSAAASIGAYDERADSITIWSSTPGRALAAARGLHGAAPARGAHPLRRARRRRRFRRQGPRLSRGVADSVPRARGEAAGAVDRGPARAFHVRPAIRATRSTTSRSASTTTAGCWRSATASSPIAAPGIRSAPASPTTPPCICPARTSSTISRSTRASPRPTRCRTRLIAAPAGRKRRSRWSGRWTSSPPSLASIRPTCGCAT